MRTHEVGKDMKKLAHAVRRKRKEKRATHTHTQTFMNQIFVINFLFNLKFPQHWRNSHNQNQHQQQQQNIEIHRFCGFSISESALVKSSYYSCS